MEKKRVLWAKKTVVICVEVWRGLVCRRWADCNGSGFITSGFHPLHLCSKEIGVPVPLWDVVSLCEGEWVTWNPSWRQRSKPAFGTAFSDWWILVSFSNCPRRCCFSLAHAAQASMARFYFHDISFLCRKSTAHKLPSQPFASARKSIAAPARTQACMRWENSMIKHTWAVQNSTSNQDSRRHLMCYWVIQLAHI